MKKIKAVILCAGYGRRLNPLTHTLPKPLVPFFGTPMLEILINKIKASGIKDIAINTHFQSEKITSFLKDKNLTDIYISHEEDLLGTAGVYRQLKNFRQGSDLLVINCDIISDFPILVLIDHYQKNDAYALMGLIKQRKEKTPIVYKDGRILSIGDSLSMAEDYLCSFSCYQILSNSFLQEIEKSEQKELIYFYQKALKEKKDILGLPHDVSFWEDIGDIKDYWQAHIRFLAFLAKTQKEQLLTQIGILPHLLTQQLINQSLDHLTTKRLSTDHEKYQGVTLIPPCFIDKDTELRAGCKIGPYAFLYGKGSLSEQSAVRNSVLLQKTTVEPVVFNDQISGPNFDIYIKPS